ncbi:MAG: CXXX repeat peptide modification system protein [Prevotella sp.]|nr:CXXX repeat peptide modification system protein [Prevotella sp.]
MRKVVGSVTEEEKKVIWEINEHKNSLEELLAILSDEDELFQDVVKDLEETKKKYQDWWNDHYEKYQWPKGNADWRILFNTNEIVIED